MWKIQLWWEGEWRDVGPGHGRKSFEYCTRREAEKMMHLAYPDLVRKDAINGTPGASVRVVRIT